MSIVTHVECPHGMKVTVTAEQDRIWPGEGHHWRAWVRNTLLACPQCRNDATAYLEDVGP